MRIKYVTINIPTQVGGLNWARCLGRSMRRPGVSVVGPQEVFTRKAKKLMRRMTRRRGWGASGLANSPNPIFFDKRVWEKVSGEVVKIHGALSKHAQYPGFNGARYVNVVVLRNRLTGSEETFLNTHLVPEGRKVAARDRFAARQKSRQVLKRIAREHLAAGRNVHIMGDMNWYKPFRLAIPGFRWIRRKGIDKAGVAPRPGGRVLQATWKSFRAPTDHKQGIEITVEIA